MLLLLGYGDSMLVKLRGFYCGFYCVGGGMLLCNDVLEILEILLILLLLLVLILLLVR